MARRSVYGTSVSPESPRRKQHSPSSPPYRTRRVPARIQRSTLNSHASSASSSSPPSTPRAVLVPLHFNLRRLPSRLAATEKEMILRDTSEDHVQVGSKRKRAPSGIENARNGGRSSRGQGRLKRLRSSSQMDTSEDEASSGMDVDSERWSQADDDSGDDFSTESSDDYLLTEAPARELLRLRKDELLRLYMAAGLADDADTFTKPEIVDAIIAARDDFAELPPSSPPGRGDSSSEYSSDDGNAAGGEETDIGNKPGGSRANALRRRQTMQTVSQTPAKPLKGRTLSLGPLDIKAARRATRHTNGVRSALEVDDESVNRRHLDRLDLHGSSPAVSSPTNSLPSPPVTRLRTRTLSGELSVQDLSRQPRRSRGKAKQVEFNDHVQVNGSNPENDDVASESDLTELTELTELEESESDAAAAAYPSPRRLRSKDKVEYQAEKAGDSHLTGKARGRGKSTRRSRGKGRRSQDVQDETEQEAQDDEEVDELMSITSPTPPPPPVRQTPVKRRLRPRKIQTFTPPSESDAGDDGDDEEETEEVDGSVDGQDEEEDAEDAESEGAVVVEPRKLRSGRVVGEDVEEDEEDIEETEEEAEVDGDGTENSEDDASEDQEEGNEDYEDEDTSMRGDDVEAEGAPDESEGEEGEDAMVDVDLTVATQKALVRLRRDDLVRMCEMRAIDPTGTKPQLAEALLQWRDRRTESSSPSSTGTVRPPSTARPRRRRGRSEEESPPVLFRSDRVHVSQPQTPPASERQREPEQDLELDLESLGLDDREIPSNKLTKLEKIGSGGFKDVFTGKFKGRKVAISEFRGQLNAMDVKELKLLGDFNHPNIVKFLGVSIPENSRETPVMIVNELCANGDLFDYVRNVPPPSLYRVLSIMLDIARGLEYLHTRKPSVIHRDCKSSNILITSKGVAKITDFGLAKVKQSTRSMVRSLVGTVNWQAPELWHAHPKYNHKVDVFSCAMVYWEMLQWHIQNKKYPWEGMNEHAIYDLVGARRQRPSVSGLRKQWCPEIVDLLERMWAHDPSSRPTMIQIVEELEQLVATYR